MKSMLYTALCSFFLVVTAQAQDLPRPSPSATVGQRVGLTDINLEYSRPGVKGRTIWGDLVPYGELWRAGANKATQFTTSEDISINGQMLPAGSYSFFILPQKEGDWTFVWNKETELWGTGDYQENQDQLRIDVAPANIDGVSERLEFHFIDVDMASATLAMDWAGRRLSVRIDANPTEQVKANIATALEEAKEEDKWKVYRSAASFAKDAGMTGEGLEWIEKSIGLNETWYGYWVYAGLLAQKNDTKGAIEKAEKAIRIGNEVAKADGGTFSYEERIAADIAEWKKK